MLKNIPKARLIEDIYSKAEKAIQSGAEMPAFSLVFDDHSCLTFYVEKAGNFLILRSYDPSNKIYKPLFILCEFQSGPREH
jgi:hypothetical protein